MTIFNDRNAVTIPLPASARAYPETGDPMTNEEWCRRELARLSAKGDTKARIARDGGTIWITRSPEKPVAG